MSEIYIIPSIDTLEESIAVSENYGTAFEYQDFFNPHVLDDEQEIARRIGIYQGVHRDTSSDTLHGAFLDVTIHSSDPLIQKVSRHRMIQSLQIASQLGCKRIVFHTNFIANFNHPDYLTGWIMENARFFRHMAANFPNIRIYMENMFDDTPFLLKKLAEEMADCPAFGICFDAAHAYLSHTPLDEWISELAPFISYIHMNDNRKDYDAHLPIGDGTIPWEEITRLMLGQRINADVVVEVNSAAAQKRSLDYMQTHGIYPFSKHR